MQVNDCIQPVRSQGALFLLHADPFQHFRERVFGEDDLLFLCSVVRDLDHRESRHERRADLIFVVCSGDRVYAHCRDHTLNVVVGESKVVQQGQKDVRRITVSFSRGSLIQLIDNKHQIGFSRHGECLHNDARLCVCIDPRASGELLRVVDRAHVQRGPWQFQDPRHRIGDLRLSGAGRADQEKPVGRQCVGAVDLDDGLDDPLLHRFHAIQLFVQDPARLIRIHRREIISLPLDIHHDRQCALGMTALFRGHLMGARHRQVSPRPEADIVRQCSPCAGHEVRNALDAGQLHTVSVLLLVLIRLLLRGRVAGKETLDHELEEAVFCRKLHSASESDLTDLIYSVLAVLCRAGEAHIDVILSHPFQKAYKPRVDPQDICADSAVLSLELKGGPPDRVGENAVGVMLQLSGAVVQDKKRMFRGRLRLICIEDRVGADRLFGT